MRLLRGLARGFGWLLILALGGAVVVFGVLYVHARFFYAPPEPEHAAQKVAYLAGMPPIGSAAPSFVVIFFDDLGWGDLSSYGNRLIRTPHVDRAAADGLRMTHFYSAAPACTPSRAALLTGRYPIRSGTHRAVFFSEDGPAATLRRMLGWGNEIPSDEILLPEVLRAGGYATGMIGKWHLGGIPGHLPNDLGFDSFYGVLWSNDMQPLHVYRNREIEVFDDTERQRFGIYRDEDTPVARRGTDQSRLTERYTEEAIAFLEANRERPFFLYLAHTFPHVPHFASADHAGESEGGLYGDVVEDLDRSTGAILFALERLDLAERTLVIITSDNGADYNGSAAGLRGRKGETYEGGQRVPMVVRWPGRVPAGVVSDAMAMNIDLFPTLIELAGLPLPEDRVIDGADLAPLLEGRGGSPHDLLFYFPVLGDQPAGVRDARFKYLRETGERGRSKPHLSRLDADLEAHNLIARFPDESRRLRDALERMDGELADNPRGWR